MAFLQRWRAMNFLILLDNTFLINSNKSHQHWSHPCDYQSYRSHQCHHRHCHALCFQDLVRQLSVVSCLRPVWVVSLCLRWGLNSFVKAFYGCLKIIARKNLFKNPKIYVLVRHHLSEPRVAKALVSSHSSALLLFQQS